MDAVREDMTAVKVVEKDADERIEWRRRIAVAIPNGRRSMLLCLYLFVFCILTLGTVQHICNEEKLT